MGVDVLIYDYVIVDNEIWAIGTEYNYLYRMDLDDFFVKEVLKIPCGLPKDVNFTRWIVENNNILYIGMRNGSATILFNINKMKFEILEDTVMNMFDTVFKQDSILWGVTGTNNKLYSLNLNTWSCKEYLYGSNEDKFISITVLGNKLYFVNVKREIIIVDETLNNQVIKRIHIPDECNIEYLPESYRHGLVGNDSIVLFPRYSDKILLITEQENYIECIDTKLKYLYSGQMISCAEKYDSNYICYSELEKKLIVYDEKFDVKEKYVVVFTKEHEQILKRDIVNIEGEIKYENSFVNLETFISEAL